MNEADAIELVQAAIWTVIMVAGPCVLAAMVVGIISTANRVIFHPGANRFMTGIRPHLADALW